MRCNLCLQNIKRNKDSFSRFSHSKHDYGSVASIDSLCRYVMTDGLRVCLEMVRRMSAEVFLHIKLYSGHVDVTAEKRRVKSSFLANSSTAGTYPDNRNKT